MSLTHPWIILFDIDGTLLTVNRTYNRRLLRELLDELEIHYPEMEKDAFSGRTDHDIFTSFMVNHDFDQDLYQQLKLEYLRRIDAELNADKVVKHEFVDEAIAFFSGSGFVKGLMTGNYPPAAEIKLRAAGIKFEYTIGAFGEDEHDRNRLPLLALQQAKDKLGLNPDPSRFVVIGDTPRDIECASSAGMRCIAVTTGRFGKEELAEHQPDLVIEDLSNPEVWFGKLEATTSSQKQN